MAPRGAGGGTGAPAHSERGQSQAAAASVAPSPSPQGSPLASCPRRQEASLLRSCWGLGPSSEAVTFETLLTPPPGLARGMALWLLATRRACLPAQLPPATFTFCLSLLL